MMHKLWFLHNARYQCSQQSARWLLSRCSSYCKQQIFSATCFHCQTHQLLNIYESCITESECEETFCKFTGYLRLFFTPLLKKTPIVDKIVKSDFLVRFQQAGAFNREMSTRLLNAEQN